MEGPMLERVLALIELNLFATVVVGLVYGVLFMLIFREISKGHQSLERIEASAERITQSAERIAAMVRDLHQR
jgi:hypothetical protein